MIVHRLYFVFICFILKGITCDEPERSLFNWFRGGNKSTEPADKSASQVNTSHSPGSMVDPQRVVSYEDMLKFIQEPEKVVIDVRNPEEVSSTGKIPSSINIPLQHVDDVLNTMSDEDFLRRFQRKKPKCSDELIFYCKSGRRSSEALDKALKLGYSRSKTYLGSWNDWSSRQN